MAQAIERLLATPNTMPVLPSSMGHRLPQRAIYSVTMQLARSRAHAASTARATVTNGF
jgi:hypothetical protein